MIEWNNRHFGCLVFDRDAIVRAALRAYVETSLHGIARFGDPAYDWVEWEGDLARGALLHIQENDRVVVAWTEVGIVGLAYEFTSGPVDQLGLSRDAVTSGPDDVRGAVPGLPDELEPAFVRAVGLLETRDTVYLQGDLYELCSEKLAGVGFWLCGDSFGGTLFTFHDVYSARGAQWLAPWGLLHKGRLLQRSCEGIGYLRPGKVVVNHARPQDAPAHAIMDAVVDRRLKGPTEFTPAELETLLHPALSPEQLLGAQRSLKVVGITWPGSPELPPETPRPRINPFTDEPSLRPEHEHLIRCFGPVQFNRDAIVRAALRAYIECILAPLDPLARHTLPACAVPKWTGDLQRGAFFNGDGCGNYDVVAWTEAGVVGLAYKRGQAGIEQLGAALPNLPDELLPALDMAASLLEVGAHGEKLTTIGFWQHGERTAGTLFDDPTLPGAPRLVAWGALDRHGPWTTVDETGRERIALMYGKGRLPLLGDRDIAALAMMLARTIASPIHALIDAVTDRALKGRTELLPDELATLFPTPPDPDDRFVAERMLQKAGITWPGVPENPEASRGAGRFPWLPSPRAIARCHPLGFLIFDKETIIRAAFRACVERTFAFLDPRQCHPMPPLFCTWTGDLQRGAFSNGDCGKYNVVAWSEAGVVGIAYESCWRSPESVPEGPVATNPDDVRRIVPDLPDQLLPALKMACDLIDQRPQIINTARVGFWLCGDRVGGTLFEMPTANGGWRLAEWGRIGRGRLLPPYPGYTEKITEDTFRAYAPFLAVVDAVVERALKGPTELTPDELATLFPVPPLPGPALPYQRKLQQVGITWPGSPEIPPA